MLQLGQFNTLTVLRRTSVGLFLGDDQENEVLLPNKYIADIVIGEGDSIEVFIYRDSEDRLIAVTDTPLIMLNQFAYLQVKDVNKTGAFLDWGMEKDLFVPYREQLKKMEEDRSYVVYMYLDEETDRLVATNKVNRFFDNQNCTLEIGDEVDILVWEVNELGVRVIVDNRYKGLVYHDFIFTHLELGERRKAYVHNVREDKLLDIVLEKPGYDAVEPNAAKVLSILKEKGGYIALNDKSDPYLIYREFEISKKLFKKAIGTLYRRRQINIEEDGIRLT